MNIRLSPRVGSMCLINECGITQNTRIDVIIAVYGAPFPFFEKIQGRIDRNRLNPCIEGRFTLELKQ